MRINTGCFLDGCKCFNQDDEDGVGVKPDKEWVGLTLEEMHELEKEFLGWPVDQVGMLLINAAQDKLKEKNCV